MARPFLQKGEEDKKQENGKQKGIREVKRAEVRRGQGKPTVTHHKGVEETDR